MKKILQVIFIFGFLAISAYTIYITIGDDLGIRDSSALYGGEIERGYPSAGFLISYSSSGGSKTCGYSVLNNRLAITASHCVDDSQSIYIGKGDFTINNSQNIQVLNAIQKQGWIQNEERSQDFAILNFLDDSSYFQSFAEIASPREGCDMRVVAYGRTENPSEISTKPRKSGIVCASDINSDTFFIQGNNSGICFGDSGSPVYYNGTNKVVGVVASIVLEDPNDTSNPCSIGNTAIVVRADAQQRIINENIQDVTSGQLASVSVTDGLSVQVVNENLLERFGLDNLSEEQKQTYLLYGSITGVVLMILILLFVLLSGRQGGTGGEAYY